MRKRVYNHEESAEASKALAQQTSQSDSSSVGSADPFSEMIGMVSDPDGLSDMAEQHDHYLYGARKRSD